MFNLLVFLIGKPLLQLCARAAKNFTLLFTLFYKEFTNVHYYEYFSLIIYITYSRYIFYKFSSFSRTCILFPLTKWHQLGEFNGVKDIMYIYFFVHIR